MAEFSELHIWIIFLIISKISITFNTISQQHQFE